MKYNIGITIICNKKFCLTYGLRGRVVDCEVDRIKIQWQTGLTASYNKNWLDDNAAVT